jgi:hypothetical protein
MSQPPVNDDASAGSSTNIDPTREQSYPSDPASHEYAGIVVEELAGRIGPRAPGSQQEQRAAEYVLASCRAAGVPAIAIPARAPIVSAWPELICLFGGLCAQLVTLLWGITGVVLGVVALAIYLSDILRHPRVLAMLPSRPSTTVLAIVPPRFSDLRRVVLTAGLDSPRVGLLSAGPLTALRNRLEVVVAVALGVAALAAGVSQVVDRIREGFVLLVPAAALLALLALIAEREWRGAYSPGAITNASSVAALLAAAGRAWTNPAESVELWFLALAASEAGQAGMRQFLADNQFDADTTLFFNLESVGAGSLRYAISEGGLWPRRAAPALARLVAAAAETDPALSVRPLARLWRDTPAGVASAAGYQALSVVGCDDHGYIPYRDQLSDTPDKVDVSSVARASRLALRVVELLDAEMTEQQRRARLARSEVRWSGGASADPGQSSPTPTDER